MPELHPLLADRWSPRGFDDRHEVGRAEVASLLEAARWAPSADNRQPWRFVVGRRDDETHKRIFECLAAEDQRWAWRASVLIAAGYVDGSAAPSPADAGPAAPSPSPATGDATTAGPATAGPVGSGVAAAYDLGQAVAHLGVQAGALRLYTHQLSRFDAARLGRELDLPGGVVVAAVIAVGRLGDPGTLPADLRLREFRLRERRPVRDLLLASAL